MKKRILTLLIALSLVASFAVPSYGSDVEDNFPGVSTIYVTNPSGERPTGQSSYMTEVIYDGYFYIQTYFTIQNNNRVSGRERLEVVATNGSSLDSIVSFEYSEKGSAWADATDYVVNKTRTFTDKHSITRKYRIKIEGDISLSFKYRIDTPAGIPDYDSYTRYLTIENGEALTWHEDTGQSTDPADIQYNVEDYGDGEGQTPYPTKDGCVFAGWYTDKSYETPFTGETGKAYAKFVDAKVLSLKWQWKTDKTALRFVSTIDSLNYQTVGFVFSGTYGTKEIELKDKESSTVYNKLGAGSGAVTPTNAFENTDSKYFFTYTIRNMDASTHSTWTVTPYYVTLGGIKVMGTTKSFNSDTQQ